LDFPLVSLRLVFFRGRFQHVAEKRFEFTQDFPFWNSRQSGLYTQTALVGKGRSDPLLGRWESRYGFMEMTIIASGDLFREMTDRPDLPQFRLFLNN
jgi:hypothetical protein